MNSPRGFTLIEASISILIFALLLGTVSISLVRDTNAQEIINAHVGPEMKVRGVLHRIGVDLRMAGVWGEDLNHNASGVLEPGEDLNLNGVLDADWNLADGASTSDISFNTREDLRYNAGNVISTGVYSAKKRYYLENGTVFREVTTYPGGTATVKRARLADNVKNLTFSRAGGLVRVRAVVDVRTARGGDAKDSILETRVWLRN